jgi:predicted enzyme related to lactoylglutathione lyase
MLEKVFYTSVLVSDQDKALDFYTNVLGLEKRVENPTPDGPRFLTVGVEGDDFQLVLWPGTPGQAQPAMGRPPASITIETDDCRRTVEELKSRGVEFVSDVLEFPWGYVAQFQDPDGNRLQIREGRQSPERKRLGASSRLALLRLSISVAPARRRTAPAPLAQRVARGLRCAPASCGNCATRQRSLLPVELRGRTVEPTSTLFCVASSGSTPAEKSGSSTRPRLVVRRGHEVAGADAGGAVSGAVPVGGSFPPMSSRNGG